MSNHEAVKALVVTIPVAQEMLGGVSRSSILRYIDAGELEALKIGGRRMVLAQSVRDYVERLRAA